MVPRSSVTPSPPPTPAPRPNARPGHRPYRPGHHPRLAGSSPTHGTRLGELGGLGVRSLLAPAIRSCSARSFGPLSPRRFDPRASYDERSLDDHGGRDGPRPPHSLGDEATAAGTKPCRNHTRICSAMGKCRYARMVKLPGWDWAISCSRMVIQPLVIRVAEAHIRITGDLAGPPFRAVFRDRWRAPKPLSAARSAPSGGGDSASKRGHFRSLRHLTRKVAFTVVTGGRQKMVTKSQRRPPCRSTCQLTQL